MPHSREDVCRTTMETGPAPFPVQSRGCLPQHTFSPWSQWSPWAPSAFLRVLESRRIPGGGRCEGDLLEDHRQARAHHLRHEQGRKVDAWSHMDARAWCPWTSTGTSTVLSTGGSITGRAGPREGRLLPGNDGKADAWAYQGPGGQVARVEMSTRRDGIVSRTEFFEAGRLARVEEDSDGDGKLTSGRRTARAPSWCRTRHQPRWPSRPPPHLRSGRCEGGATPLNGRWARARHLRRG